MTEFGQLRPIDVMRVFMGSSRPYSALGGYLELIGGMMLCFRRTTLLGAFLVLGVMLNVFALNLFYGFGMKRFSIEIIVYTTVIMIPYFSSFFKFAVLNQAVTPINLYGPWTQVKYRRIGTMFMCLWMCVAIAAKANDSYQFTYNYTVLGPKGPLEGDWEATQMKIAHQSRPAILGDKQRWRSLTLRNRPLWKFATVGYMDGSHEYFSFAIKDGILELRDMSFSSDLSNTKLHATLQYQKVGNDQLNLKGKHKEAEVELSLRLREPSSFPALSHKLKLITGEIKRIE